MKKWRDTYQIFGLKAVAYITEIGSEPLTQ